MLKAILWDNDGVLVDTEGLYFQACRESLERLGIPLSEARFIDFFLKASEGLTKIAAEHGIDKQALEPTRVWRNARYIELLRAGVPVIDGALQVLRQLQGTVRMGIVTSCRREHFEIIHSATGLLNCIDFTLVREDYSHSKPDPEPYLTAMRQNGLSAAECVVIEDSDRGLRAALAAGLRCIVIPQGLTRDLDFTGALRELSDIRQVPPLVHELMQT
ncbi:MAG: Phosphorylated carbohydrates phosphatase [Nitrospira sp.]|nr:Phosphorylated carbohydrates phosphatase [Nitrospira sp.]